MCRYTSSHRGEFVKQQRIKERESYVFGKNYSWCFDFDVKTENRKAPCCSLEIISICTRWNRYDNIPSRSADLLYMSIQRTMYLIRSILYDNNILGFQVGTICQIVNNNRSIKNPHPEWRPRMNSREKERKKEKLCAGVNIIMLQLMPE